MEHALNSFISQLKTQYKDPEELLRAIYLFIRDEIRFDFLPEIDDITAEEIFRLKLGQCNNKTLLFFTILQKLGFESKVHFSTIDKSIHKGFFPDFILGLVPDEILHSWIEVSVGGKWVVLDGYINDKTLYEAARKENLKRGWATGHSVSEGSCGSNIEFALDGKNFVQMAAVKKDLGLTDDPYSFLQSDLNPNRPRLFKKILYRLFLPLIRGNVKRLRASS